MLLSIFGAVQILVECSANHPHHEIWRKTRETYQRTIGRL